MVVTLGAIEENPMKGYLTLMHKVRATIGYGMVLKDLFTHKWLKETLGLEKGDIKYDTDFERVQSNLVWLDSGILVLPFSIGSL